MCPRAHVKHNKKYIKYSWTHTKVQASVLLYVLFRGSHDTFCVLNMCPRAHVRKTHINNISHINSYNFAVFNLYISLHFWLPNQKKFYLPKEMVNSQSPKVRTLAKSHCHLLLYMNSN
jgi:hypothetical protein